jgi:hypothetical protein
VGEIAWSHTRSLGNLARKRLSDERVLTTNPAVKIKSLLFSQWLIHEDVFYRCDLTKLGGFSLQ